MAFASPRRQQPPSFHGGRSAEQASAFLGRPRCSWACTKAGMGLIRFRRNLGVKSLNSQAMDPSWPGNRCSLRPKHSQFMPCRPWEDQRLFSDRCGQSQHVFDAAPHRMPSTLCIRRFRRLLTLIAGGRSEDAWACPLWLSESARLGGASLRSAVAALILVPQGTDSLRPWRPH